MYKDMTKILSDANVGKYRLEHFTISHDDLYAIFHNIPPGDYVRLLHANEVMMSDTPMEKQTNEAFVNNAHGDVLVGGLGLGMILLAIQDKEDVESITVVENSIEVIELVKNQLPLNKKVNVVLGDIFTYTPSKKYNTIYIDIWSYVNSCIYENEMVPLLDYYQKYLVSDLEDADRYISCWCLENAANNVAF